jgi:hypothetical protein
LGKDLIYLTVKELLTELNYYNSNTVYGDKDYLSGVRVFYPVKDIEKAKNFDCDYLDSIFINEKYPTFESIEALEVITYMIMDFDTMKEKLYKGKVLDYNDELAIAFDVDVCILVKP